MVVLKQIRLRECIAVRVTSADSNGFFLIKTEAWCCLAACGDGYASSGLYTTACSGGDPTHTAQEVEGNPFSDEDIPYAPFDTHDLISFFDDVSVTVEGRCSEIVVGKNAFGL